MSWLLPALPSFLTSSAPSAPAAAAEPTSSSDAAADDADDDDDSPPPFPLPESHQRSSAPSSAPKVAPLGPPPLPAPSTPSFTVTAPAAAPELRNPLEFTDDDFNYDQPPAKSRKAAGAAAGLATPTTTTKVVKTREKVALEPGCSALDWSRVQKSGMWQGAPLKGANLPHHPIRVTPSLLAAHKHAADGDQWTAINGRVYNLTPYAKFHPGGVKELMRCAGRDGTKLFMATHAWVNPEFMMEGCWVGMMVSE